MLCLLGKCKLGEEKFLEKLGLFKNEEKRPRPDSAQ